MSRSDVENNSRNRTKRLVIVSATAILLAAGFTGPARSQSGNQSETEGNNQDDPRNSTSRIELLLKSGAYDLALNRIDDIQSKVDDIQEWLGWENLRYELYQKRGDWDRLTDRLLRLPPDVPEIKRHDLMTHAAELLIASGRGDGAREILRALIWRSSGDSSQLNRWRRLVVRSYLVDDSTHDAQIAMNLYDLEYLPADTGWDYLFAQVLLRQGDADLAAQRLGSAQEPAARVLRLLARLRSSADTPQQVLSKAAELRGELPEKSSLAAVNWAVAAEAAGTASDLESRVEALEQLFDGPGLPSEFSLFGLTVTDLWEAYTELGAGIGNERNLLFGNPEPWMALAESLKGTGSALRARAINAAVAIRSTSEPERGRLHLALYQRLAAAEFNRLAIRLYESEEVFPTVNDVPDIIRHQIVSDAIEQRNMTLAAKFALHLSAPNSEQTQLQWDLTRARLALYAGDFSQSESIMRSLILSRSTFEPELADRVMQPVFDLQSVGHGAVAFELFQYLYERVPSKKQKREILLWMGDAKKSEGEYEAAAEYYLRSAFAGPEPYDLWGQSARYHAAEAMAEARLFEDARRIYEQLLKEVGEGTQAAALQRRLQELWVKKQERRRIH